MFERARPKEFSEKGPSLARTRNNAIHRGHLDSGERREKDRGGDEQCAEARRCSAMVRLFCIQTTEPDVRGVSSREIAALLPGSSIYLKRVTLAPPIARAISPFSAGLYRLSPGIKLLRTHYMGFFQRQ